MANKRMIDSSLRLRHQHLLDVGVSKERFKETVDNRVDAEKIKN